MASKLIPLSKIPEVLEKNFGEKRSRMTVYHWARVGVGGKKLKTTKRVGKLYTTLDNLRRGMYQTRTVGMGAAKNSVLR